MLLSTARCYVSVWLSYVVVKVVEEGKHDQAHFLALHSYLLLKCLGWIMAYRSKHNILFRILNLKTFSPPLRRSWVYMGICGYIFKMSYKVASFLASLQECRKPMWTQIVQNKINCLPFQRPFETIALESHIKLILEIVLKKYWKMLNSFSFHQVLCEFNHWLCPHGINNI